MSITFAKELDGLFVVTIKGILAHDELKEIENNAEKNIQDQKIKILVHAEEFTGWDKEGDWGDLTFMHEHDPYIEKIAVVADQKWQNEVLMFLGAGRRQASVEFFSPDEIQDARYWLHSKSK